MTRQAGQAASSYGVRVPGQAPGGSHSGGGAQGGGVPSPSGGQAGGREAPSGGHGHVDHPKGGVGACPMGVECVSQELHGGLAGAGVGQGQGVSNMLQRVGGQHPVQAPMSHGNDHWLTLSASEVPIGVRTMLAPGSGWRTYRADRRWYGFDGRQYYAWLVDGPAPLAGAPGLGADPATLTATNCCQTNSGLYWIAGAIFTLAVAVGANVMKGPKKGGKKKS